MGTCSCTAYCHSNNANNQNVISLDIPNRTSVASTRMKAMHSASQHEQQFKMLTGQSSGQNSSLCSSQPSLRNTVKPSKVSSASSQSVYNAVTTNSSLSKKPKQQCQQQSSPMKNRTSSTSTNPNSLSSSFSSANNVCSFKHNTLSNDNNVVVGQPKPQSESVALSKEEEELLNNKRILKVAILGGKGVGKTSFLLKVLHNKFEKLYIPTIDIEKRTKVINSEGKQYTFYFIVTPGDSIYKSDCSVYFQKANFICVFYDMSAVDSFNEAKQLLFEEIKDYKEMISSGKTHINVIGNKKDIANSKLNSSEIKSFCEANRITLYEISVKSGVGLKLLMNDICNKFDSANK